MAHRCLTDSFSRKLASRPQQFQNKHLSCARSRVMTRQMDLMDPCCWEPYRASFDTLSQLNSKTSLVAALLVHAWTRSPRRRASLLLYHRQDSIYYISSLASAWPYLAVALCVYAIASAPSCETSHPTSTLLCLTFALRRMIFRPRNQSVKCTGSSQSCSCLFTFLVTRFSNTADRAASSIRYVRIIGVIFVRPLSHPLVSQTPILRNLSAQ
ncbi:hypothetical protein EDB81DRAFT_64419 [Dactylonectria macrodidyma]|uniref:Uncharacterized protein n=1 Tax=Dactylonectria macrodidyma TaxID=307937 RepID=A0A9P9EPC7_9HYPO|nr:hypothetical protein EDB81DRAFT_64419 [Dactylonectria macrodidyma]